MAQTRNNFGHRRSPLYRVFKSIRRFFYRLKVVYSNLNKKGRIIAVSSAAVIVAALVLIIALPKKQDEGLAYSVMSQGAQTGSGADTEENMLRIDLPAEDIAAEPTPSPAPTPDLTMQKDMEDGPRVTELQERLMNLGYLDLDEPTEHFGPATEYAVQLFQRQYGMEQTGVLSAEDLELLYSSEAKKYTLLEETRGTDVESFQRQLKELGYLKKVTGYYGTETIEAVKAFQKENKLSADGKAGEKTLEMINSDKAKLSPTIAKEARRKANINDFIAIAKKQLGKKYILGNEGPNSYDCSGLVYYCLKQAGSNRRRLNAAGYSNVSDWEKITSYSKLQKGDLLFFTNDAGTKIGHVGIYIGGGEMVDASSNNGKVVRRSATTSYWKKHFVCARRPW